MRRINKTDDYTIYTLNNYTRLYVSNLPNKTLKVESRYISLEDHVRSIDSLIRFYKGEYRKYNNTLIIKSQRLDLSQYESFNKIITYLEFLE